MNQEVFGDNIAFDFALEDIDQSLFFIDDYIDAPKEDVVLEPDEDSPLFVDWLSATVVTEDDEELLPAFKKAQQEGAKVAKQLELVNAVGLSGVGQLFSSLSGIIGSCGVACFGGLAHAASAGTSGLSAASGLGSLGMPGLSVDEHGHIRFEGSLDSLSSATGLSKADLLSGKFSINDILMRFFSVFGEGVCNVFGFGLIECLIDGLIPSPQGA
jgi:hypothetical protein